MNVVICLTIQYINLFITISHFFFLKKNHHHHHSLTCCLLFFYRMNILYIRIFCLLHPVFYFLNVLKFVVVVVVVFFYLSEFIVSCDDEIFNEKNSKLTINVVNQQTTLTRMTNSWTTCIQCDSKMMMMVMIVDFMLDFMPTVLVIQWSMFNLIFFSRK